MNKTFLCLTFFCALALSCKRGDESLTCPPTKEYLKEGLGNRKFVLPNAFTPNGNGMNDRLTVLTNDSTLIRSMEIKISDASGNLLFTLTKNSPIWYGMDASNKAYPTGKYGVDYSVVLNDSAGNPVTREGHTCISVLSAYDTIRNGFQIVKCVKAPESYNNYYLEDMFDPLTLETPYVTGENFCQ